MPEESEYVRVEEERPKRSKARFAVLGACALLGLEASGLLHSTTHGPLTSLATLLSMPKARSAALNPPGARFGLRHTVAPRAPAAFRVLPQPRAVHFAPMIARAAAEEAEPEKTNGEAEAEAEVVPSDEAAPTEGAEAEPVAEEAADGAEGAAKDGDVDWDEAMKGLKDRAQEVEANAEEEPQAPAAPMVTKEQYDRLYADFDNFRRRTATEKTELVSATKGNMLKELLAVLDNFERASTAVKPSTEGEEKINTSYQGLYKQMLTIFSKLGLETMEVNGATFDPAEHEAIMAEENAEVPDQTIVEVFMNGYRYNGKLLRPATVKVATGGPSKPASPPAEESEPTTAPADSDEAAGDN